MGQQTGISWTDHTFNHIIGCTKVAPGCVNCYAEDYAKRYNKAKWGPQGTRVKTSEGNWIKPRTWNNWAQMDERVHAMIAEHAGETTTSLAARAGIRLDPMSASCKRLEDRGLVRAYTNSGHWRAITVYRRPKVFCASLSDVFEDWEGAILHHTGARLLRCDVCGAYHADTDQFDAESCKCGRFGQRMDWATMEDLRRSLFNLIDATPHLDWLLLTKRPESVGRMIHDAHNAIYRGNDNGVPSRNNLWLGTSASDQETADRNTTFLQQCRDLAPVLFVSAEPLLGPVWFNFTDMGDVDDLDWVIVGGESGSNRRPMEVEWAQSIADQCRAAGVACFIKQDAALHAGQQGRLSDELWGLKEFPK